MKGLAFLVIALNIPIFLIGWVLIIGGFQDMRFMILGIFTMLFSASNIVPAFGHVGNPFQTGIPRYRLTFFLNIITILFVIAFFASPFARVSFIHFLILASAMISILFLLRLRQIPSQSDDTLAVSVDVEPRSEEESKKIFKTLIRYQKISGYAFSVGLFALFTGVFLAYMAYDIGYPYDTLGRKRFSAFLCSLSIISFLISRYFDRVTSSKKPGSRLS